MVMYRVIEKLHLNILLDNGWLSYIVTAVGTIVGAVIFSVVVKKLIEIVDRKAAQIKVDRKVTKG